MTLRDEQGELPEVGPWAERKYELLRHYLSLFATGMRKLWRTRIYVDLFTGAGRAVVEGTDKRVPTSALIALALKHPFDRYVLCEGNRSRMEALRARVSLAAPGRDVRYVQGDCNRGVDRILAELPAATASDVLTACFVDPFGISDLKFATLRRLADRRRIDFLVLVPSHMDATRNEARLTRDEDPLLDDFLGSRDWRARWSAASRAPAPPSFGGFIVEEFGRSMQGLGYLRFDPKDAELVDAHGRRLYHLALFSKNPRGADFWKKAKRSASRQRELFDERG
jgi:three-Cys-motif partner protein